MKYQEDGCLKVMKPILNVATSYQKNYTWDVLTNI